MLGFIIGLFIGCFIGVAIMCLMSIASHTEDNQATLHIEKVTERIPSRQTDCFYYIEEIKMKGKINYGVNYKQRLC